MFVLCIFASFFIRIFSLLFNAFCDFFPNIFANQERNAVRWLMFTVQNQHHHHSTFFIHSSQCLLNIQCSYCSKNSISNVRSMFFPSKLFANVFYMTFFLSSFIFFVCCSLVFDVSFSSSVNFLFQLFIFSECAWSIFLFLIWYFGSFRSSFALVSLFTIFLLSIFHAPHIYIWSFLFQRGSKLWILCPAVQASECNMIQIHSSFGHIFFVLHSNLNSSVNERSRIAQKQRT